MFEFDQAKSESNFVKHGIDFVKAQDLWKDPNLIEVPARNLDEPRFLMIGTIENRHWSAIVTHREGSIRIISVRRSRVLEVKIYEG